VGTGLNYQHSRGLITGCAPGGLHESWILGDKINDKTGQVPWGHQVIGMVKDAGSKAYSQELLLSE